MPAGNARSIFRKIAGRAMTVSVGSWLAPVHRSASWTMVLQRPRTKRPMSNPHGGAPTEKAAAIPAGNQDSGAIRNNNSSINTTTSLALMASGIIAGGPLRRYVPRRPRWCRRIGDDVITALMSPYGPDESEVRMLHDAYERAVSIREQMGDVSGPA
jgi:hypothetical protein